MNDLEIAVPAQALAAMEALESAGHEAWCVGGFVRDAIVGRRAYDVDIATSAHWEQSKAALESHGAKVFETGTKHGTVTAVFDGVGIEVTTFRSDGPYTDGRHPDQVVFVGSVEEDLARRDFTMNAIAWHPERGLRDPFGGRADIASRTIRAVGDPDRRFREDALRILRGVRFASQLGFAVEPRTEAAMRRLAPLVKSLSVERVFRELDGLLAGRFAGKALLDFADIVGEALPEIPRGGALEHAAAVIAETPDESAVRWAALLQDAGNPRGLGLDGNGTGPSRERAGLSALIARDVAKRLRFPSKLADDVRLLVLHHDDEPPCSRRSLRRAVRQLGPNPGLFALLCELQRADAAGHAPGNALRARQAARALDLLSEELGGQPVFGRKDLAVSGSDLVAMGAAPGPGIGAILDDVLDAVIDERLENDAEHIKRYVVENFFQNSLDEQPDSP